MQFSTALKRSDNYWLVSTEVGKKDGFLRAEVGEADPLVPPVNGSSKMAASGLPTKRWSAAGRWRKSSGEKKRGSRKQPRWTRLLQREILLA